MYRHSESSATCVVVRDRVQLYFDMSNVNRWPLYECLYRVRLVLRFRRSVREKYLYHSMVRGKTRNVHCFCVLSSRLPSTQVTWSKKQAQDAVLHYSPLLRRGGGGRVANRILRFITLGHGSLPLEEAVEVFGCGRRKKTVPQPEKEDSAST